MKKINLIFLIFLTLFSCGRREEEEEFSELQERSFFDIVYQTVAVRPIGNNTWRTPTGVREVLFDITTDISDDEQLPQNIQGNYTIVYTGYTRDISNIPPCQGGYEGTFTVENIVSDNISQEDAEDDGIYTVFDNYSNGVLPDEGDVEVLTYRFDLSETNRSLNPVDGCPALLNNYTLRAIRFQNGEVIMEDVQQGLEFFMRPKVI